MITFQSNLPPKDIAAAASTSMFLRDLSSSISIVVGLVLVQMDIGGGQVTAGSDSPGSAEDYVSAMRLMRTFYTVITRFMTFTSMFIRKVPKKDKSETESAELARKGLAELDGNKDRLETVGFAKVLKDYAWRI